MGRFVGSFLALLVMAGIAAAAAGVFLYRSFLATPALLVEGDQVVEVQSGESAHRLVERLSREGLLRWSPYWRVWFRLEQSASCLQAGEHTLLEGSTPGQIFVTLCEPTRAAGIRLLVPEGTNLFQLADRVEAAGLGSRDELVELAFDPAFVRSLEVDAPSLEGYLAPDTYEFHVGSGPSDVLERMARAGAALREELWRNAVDGDAGALTGLAANFSLHELLTIASVVEEEAQVAEERPLIARVIYNRLQKRMPLQCDPTCVYGPTIYDQVPTRALCRDPNSTHSTYVLPALPPTPISNPGRAAIEAVLAPSEDAGVLYFVAMRDGTGRHAFSSTLAEHELNVTRYLRR